MCLEPHFTASAVRGAHRHLTQMPMDMSLQPDTQDKSTALDILCGTAVFLTIVALIIYVTETYMLMTTN